MEKINKYMPGYPFLAECCHSATSDLTLVGDLSDLAALLGYSVDELSGKGIADLLADQNGDAVSLLHHQIESQGETEALLSFVKKDGSLISVLERGKVVDQSGDALVCAVFVVANETHQSLLNCREDLSRCRDELRQKECMMNSYRERAERDSLTQLFNTRTTRNLCEQYLCSTENSCAMIMIDVDDFKRINDRYGHTLGDFVLSRATDTIKRLFRANDIVGRIGGDEFLVLMKDVSDPNIVELRCSQIITAFNEIKCDEMENETVGCSVGAVLSDIKNNSFDLMFCNADKLMYRCKRSGGNNYIILKME